LPAAQWKALRKKVVWWTGMLLWLPTFVLPLSLGGMMGGGAQQPLLCALGLGVLLVGGSGLASLLAMRVLTETLPPRTLFALLWLGLLLVLTYPWERLLSAPHGPFADHVLGDDVLRLPGVPCLLWTLAVLAKWLWAMYQLIRYGAPQRHAYHPLFPEAYAQPGSRALARGRGHAGAHPWERRLRTCGSTMLMALLLCVPGERGARLRDHVRSAGGLCRGAIPVKRLAVHGALHGFVLLIVLWCLGALGSRFRQDAWRSWLSSGTWVVKRYYATHQRLPDTLAEALKDLPAAEYNRLRITRGDGEDVSMGDARFHYRQTSNRTFLVWISRWERGAAVQHTGPWCEFHVRGIRPRCGWGQEGHEGWRPTVVSPGAT
jgi:hypothetical protein